MLDESAGADSSTPAAAAVVSWNVNGLRSLCPERIHQLFERLPNKEAVGFLCIQETKLSRLPRELCISDHYYSYFSLCRNSRETGQDRGYSGVATFVRKDIPTLRAQEGFAGQGSAADVLSLVDILRGRGDSSAPQSHAFTPQDVAALSDEGRVIVTDHGCFVLINVYAPCAYDEGSKRFEYKAKFNAALDTYIAELHRRGREVILVGDMNASVHRMDHCDPDSFEDPVFEERSSVRWLRGLMAREGLVDSFRRFHPLRTAAFTCWNMKTGARQTNYGTRIDLILMSSALDRPPNRTAASLLAADILPMVAGSDHCPIWAALRLPDFDPSEGTPPPPLCTIHRPDFRLEQGRIDAFLAPRDLNEAEGAASGAMRQDQITSSQKNISKKKSSLKRSFNAECTVISVAKVSKLKQMLLFENSENAASKVGDPSKIEDLWSCHLCTLLNRAVDIRCAVCISPRVATSTLVYQQRDCSSPTTREQFISLFKSVSLPEIVPLCTGHAEPCVKRTVTKEGPNKGKSFFTCSKPSGDFLKNRLARCDFFEWAKVDRNDFRTADRP